MSRKKADEKMLEEVTGGVWYTSLPAKFSDRAEYFNGIGATEGGAKLLSAGAGAAAGAFLITAGLIENHSEEN